MNNYSISNDIYSLPFPINFDQNLSLISDDVLRDKDAETRKLDEEESQYMERRKERGRKIIQIEKEELTRREDEVNNLLS